MGETYSAFAQARYDVDLLSGLLIIAGVREDFGKVEDETFTQLSPRVGVVQKLTEALNLKVLYGTALRAPGIKEYGLNAEAANDLGSEGDSIPDLGAETIQSIEVATTYTLPWLSLSVAGFWNETTDPLDGERFKEKNIFANTNGKITATGVEADLQFIVGIARVFGNFAFAEAKNKDEENVDDVPTMKGNFGVSVGQRSGVRWRATAVAKWVDGYRISPASKEANNDKSPAGHTTFDLNTQIGVTDSLTLELQGRNLGDTTARYPKGGLEDVALPGRSFHATLAHHF